MEDPSIEVKNREEVTLVFDALHDRIMTDA
jgi:hypothetical protein